VASDVRKPDLFGKDPFVRAPIIAMGWLGLLLAGCQVFDRQNPPPIAAQSASSVCAGYGIRIGAANYNDCVAYQDSRNPGPSVPPYRLDQYNNMVDAEGYVVDSMGRRMPVQGPYYFPWSMASSGQPILRDEYGNRYDSRGNRIN
jgi:hypothetical protein